MVLCLLLCGWVSEVTSCRMSPWHDFVQRYVQCVIVNGCPTWGLLCSSMQGYWMQGNMGSTSIQRTCPFNGWLLNYFCFCDACGRVQTCVWIGVFNPVLVRDIFVATNTFTVKYLGIHGAQIWSQLPDDARWDVRHRQEGFLTVVNPIRFLLMRLAGTNFSWPLELLAHGLSLRDSVD